MAVKILDVGCACGAIAYGLQQAGADVVGIELNEHMVAIARKQFPSVPVFVCDAVNMHLFDDNSFDVIHSNQVAEHWKPELVPYIFAEFQRVLRPGGKMFMVMDTVESFAREGRDGSCEDATHICVKPLQWWKDLLEQFGFICCVTQRKLYRDYKWDYILSKLDKTI